VKLIKLGAQTKLLLTVHTLFISANALSGTFVNVYLWKFKQDYVTIGTFVLASQLMMAVTTMVAGKWAKESNKMNVLRLGVVIAAAFYGVVLLLGQQAANWVMVLGALQGCSFALFWLAFNVIYFEVTNRDTRDRYNGWSGVLGSAAGMFAPWVSGFLLSQMGSVTGYRFIFSLSLGVFVVGAVMSLFLQRRPTQPNYDWLYGFRQVTVRNHPWRRASLALVGQGLREGVFGFMIGLLIYIVTQSELQLGNYALITSAISGLAYYLSGKMMKPARRAQLMLIGVIAIVIVILPLFWAINAVTLYLFGIVVALFFPLYFIPVTSVVFDLIGANEESATHRVEYVALRETALNVGRILGTIAFIITVSFTMKSSVIVTLLLVLGSAPLLTWLMMRKFLEGVR
jgi:YQGE family putative transporter